MLEGSNHFEKFDSYIPVDLLSLEGFIGANLIMLFFIGVRYFSMVFPFYLLFWKQKVGKGFFLYVHDQQAKEGQVQFEIKWSLISSLIFSLSGFAMGVFWQLGWTRIYLPFDQFPLWYLFASFVIYSLIHEIYFYWTHVWMHKPKLFKKMHAVHHFSSKTSPWASFSFHPYEALVHATFLPVLVCFVPIHPTVILFYLTFMTLTAISNHLGVELLKPKILQSIFISGTHHAFHHKDYRSNFGLYYRFMDQWMGSDKWEAK